MNRPIPLPIDELLPDVVERLRASPFLVVEAPPGAGKTTRVPPAIAFGSLLAGEAPEVWVLEPRRLAARLSARRVAEELGEPLGERVGYAVRFEDVGGPRTVLRFVTPGVLLRRMQEGRSLARVGAVVLDEFHERSLDSDLSLALLARLARAERPDLRVVVMSATLDGEAVAAFLGGCPRVRAEGRRFDVALEHDATGDDRPLEQRVASAVRKVARVEPGGDVLVFLPGAREIRRAAEACADVARSLDLALFTLHGDQPPAEQDRALRPADRRKVILATNVAETSITIDGVVAVIDSGLARVATHSPWSGLPSLRVQKISRASAAQRAGRAGRTRAGRCLRLYDRHDHDTRPAFELPEVRRADLADTVLLLRSLAADPRRFPWFEEPPDAALDAADALLVRLGALDGDRRVTAIGRRMLRLPLHPRLARLVCEAEARGVAREGAEVAAFLGEARRGGDRAKTMMFGGRRQAAVSGDSDVLAAIAGEGGGRGDGEAAWRRAERSIARLCRRDAPRPADPELALLRSILAGFPDRVARRRRPRERDVLLSSGGAASLSEASVVQDAELLVAVEAEEGTRRDPRDAVAAVVIRSASAIEADWLLDLDASLREVDELRWDPPAERVRATRKLLYDQLVLDESDLAAPDAEAVSRVLLQAARAAGLRAVFGGDEEETFARLASRVAFARRAAGGESLPLLDEAARAELLSRACAGRSSFAELRQARLVDALRAWLGPPRAALVERLAPDRVTLPGGRGARVEYPEGQPPHLGSRLQDFFGMAEGPRVGGGTVAVTLHLLAPNQRAVQVTQDLAGFWQRHYPAIRRELMRRYPKHAWPEDPLHAEPPRAGPRRP